jgi:hypothetical protein
MAILTEVQLKSKQGLAPGQTIEAYVNNKLVSITKYSTKQRISGENGGRFELVEYSKGHNKGRILKNYRYGSPTGDGTEQQVWKKMLSELGRIVPRS